LQRLASRTIVRRCVEGLWRSLRGLRHDAASHVDAAIEEAGERSNHWRARRELAALSLGARWTTPSSIRSSKSWTDGRRCCSSTLRGGRADGRAYGLDWMVGGCFEDTVTSLRTGHVGPHTRYPNIKVIVPHLGGTLPFLMQRIEDFGDAPHSARG